MKLFADGRKIVELLSAGFAEENNDGDAPEALARDAPVRAIGDHFRDAVFAPAGNPFHGGDLLQGLSAQGGRGTMGSLIHFDEPLIGCAEDDRVMAAPAMRITMFINVVTKQCAAILQ